MRRSASARRRSRAGAAIAASLLAIAPLARAGSPHWTFEVLAVQEIEHGSQRILLHPSPPGPRFPQSCENLVVLASFDLSDWSRTGREAVSREGHERSLTLLRQAQATGTLVRFGHIGRGFAAASDAPVCEVQSHGLVVLFDPGGFPVVFSLYEEPTASTFEPGSP